MPEYSQSQDGHSFFKNIDESYSRKLFFNLNEIQPVGLGVCHPKEINLYKKWKQGRESSSQAVHYSIGGKSSHIKRLKSESIQSPPFTLSTKKRQPVTHQKDRKQKLIRCRAAEIEILRQSFMSSSTVTSRISTADSSYLLGNFAPIKSCESYSVTALPVYSDSRKPYLISCAGSLHLHENYTIKTEKPNKVYELVSQESIISNSFSDQSFHQVSINDRDSKRQYTYGQQRLKKIQIKNLHRKQNSNSGFIIDSPYDNVMQTHTPETMNTPYAKTVAVYTVFNQKATKREPRSTLGSNASFNIKFYRSMGDGRQMYGNNAPYVPIPRNYSPTNMARMGRDEDGCICMYIPQQPDYERYQMGNYGGGGFLKRYFRILLKEQKRCLCGKTRSKPKPCSYASCSANYIPPTHMDYQYRYNNASNNFRGNDVSCQCKCKERRDHRPDRDIFCKDRGITCCVPKCPGVQNNNSNPNPNPNTNIANVPNGQTKGMPDKDAVNIGSNFSFQVGVYKRCLDNRPAPYSNPNPSNNYSYNNNIPANYLDNLPAPYSNPIPNNYYSYNNNMPAYDPKIPYMQSVQPSIDNCGFCCNEAPSYREPRSASVFSILLRSREPKLESKSSDMQSTDLGGENDCCSQCNSNKKAPSSSWSDFIKSQFERNDICCNNQPMSYCKPKKNKAVRCRCDKKPKLIGCTDQQNSVGIICSRSTSSQSASTEQKPNKVKNSGCNCFNEPEGILAPCTKKKKICCQCDLFGTKKSIKKSRKCFRKKSRKCGSKKSCECCSTECCKSNMECSKCCSKESCKCCNNECSKCCCKGSNSKCCNKERNKCCSKKSRKRCCKCKILKRKKCGCKKDPTFFKILRAVSTLLQKENEGGCCRCKTSDAKNTYDKSCCCNKTSKTKCRSIVRPMSMLLQKICNRCNLAKGSTCKCSNQSGEFDYKKVLDSIKMNEQAKSQRCLCGDSTMKKIFNSQLVAPEPTQTKAQQCKCLKSSNMKKKFGRLLLYNTVQPKPISCSGVTYDQNSRSIGTGEDDYRKVPPCRRARVQDGSQGDGFALKKLVSKLINPEKCCTRMHYTAFNPQNQCEAGVQHIGRVGPDERAGRETICRNQGVECPRSKPLTRKDCENVANACPASQQDSDRRAVRLGSSCSFCLEFYKGAPPPKNLPTCPPTRSAPPALPTRSAPCETATNSAFPEGDNTCCPTKTPCPPRQPIMKQALSYLILTQKKRLRSKFTTTCQKCNKCVKVPLIKKGFAQLILKDKKPVINLNDRTCQRTNTLQPNRKLIVRKPATGAKRGKGGLGNSRNCDPYVCLKRINQRKCCNAK